MLSSASAVETLREFLHRSQVGLGVELGSFGELSFAAALVLVADLLLEGFLQAIVEEKTLAKTPHAHAGPNWLLFYGLLWMPCMHVMS